MKCIYSDIDGCKNIPTHNSQCCSQHMCRVYGCKNPRPYKSKFLGLGRITYYVCTSHMCKWDSCFSPAKDKGYCDEHEYKAVMMGRFKS